jgi:hypothetical protein
MYKRFLAVDQYGNKHFVDHPRKELCEFHGVKHANKIYRSTEKGDFHVGYKVSGHWYEVMRLSPLDPNMN